MDAKVAALKTEVARLNHNAKAMQLKADSNHEKLLDDQYFKYFIQGLKVGIKGRVWSM